MRTKILSLLILVLSSQVSLAGNVCPNSFFLVGEGYLAARCSVKVADICIYFDNDSDRQVARDTIVSNGGSVELSMCVEMLGSKKAKFVSWPNYSAD